MPILRITQPRNAFFRRRGLILLLQIRSLTWLPLMIPSNLIVVEADFFQLFCPIQRHLLNDVLNVVNGAFAPPFPNQNAHDFFHAFQDWRVIDKAIHSGVHFVDSVVVSFRNSPTKLIQTRSNIRRLHSILAKSNRILLILLQLSGLLFRNSQQRDSLIFYHKLWSHFRQPMLLLPRKFYIIGGIGALS